MRVSPRILGITAALAAGLVTATALRAQQADQDLERQADTIAADVARIRGLAIKRPIDRGVMNKSQIRTRLVARMAEEYTPEELAAEALALERLGLLPAGVDYQKLVLDLLTDQIAGFYDPWERRLYIADWAQMGKEVAMAHEIDKLRTLIWDMGNLHRIQESMVRISENSSPYARASPG